jgi:hypothetical protein
MSNKEVLVPDMVIGCQDNKRKEQRDPETSAKKQKNITSVPREDPKKNQNTQKTREKQQQDEYPGLLFHGAVLALLDYITRLIYLGKRYIRATTSRCYM